MDLPFSFSNFALYTFCSGREGRCETPRVTDIETTSDRQAALPRWRACWSPCCGPCPGSLAEWWRSRTACPSYWPLCTCSEEGRITIYKLVLRVIGVSSKYGRKKTILQSQSVAIYLGGQSAHGLGVQDLRSVLDRHVLALCFLVFLLIFHLQGGIIQPLAHKRSPLLIFKSQLKDRETHRAGHFIVFQSQDGQLVIDHWDHAALHHFLVILVLDLWAKWWTRLKMKMIHFLIDFCMFYV